jgi:hypothetical protein
VLALLALVLPALAVRSARPVLLNLGPNDVEYVEGFREDWERDRLTRFHWTSLSAAVRLPVVLRGAGHVLRMRVRRHFHDPARIAVRVEGQLAGAFEIAADTKVPYRVVEVPLPKLEGRAPFRVELLASTENPRPLGVAIDWIEIQRQSQDAHVYLMNRSRFFLVVLVGLAFLLPRLAGSSTWSAGLHASLVLTGVVMGAWWDVIALERIVTEGTPTYAAVGLLALLLVTWARSRRFLGVDQPSARTQAGALVLVVLVGAALRLVLVLHPQFYYPDVKVHALFAWQLARQGLARFLQDFTANQFRYSLGLQFENGHWYAFPYPPAFYVLTWPLIRLFRYRPEVAVSLLGAAVNSLEALVVFGIARRLGRGAAVALAAAAAAPVLPIFMVRLGLAYFPALVGHAVDAVVILYLLSRLEALDRSPQAPTPHWGWRVRVALGVLIALALLIYTQSLLNFALLLPLFLVIDVVRDSSAEGRRRQLGLFTAGAMGALFALAIFYGRYIPTFLDMRKGVPMAEEHIVLEKFARQPVIKDDVEPQEPDHDPYTGPNLDVARGVRKAAWRLYVFYGLFAPVIAAGIVLLWKDLTGPAARFVASWAFTYLLLNLASGGLPGPNLVRYNKDLEIVAPLFCVALATVGAWLWTKSRVLAVLYGSAFTGYGLWRAVRALVDRFVLER